MNVFPLADMIERLGLPDDGHVRKALTLGLGVRFLASHWGNAEIASRLLPILTATETDRYELYFDSMGREVGFVDWILANADGHSALLAKGPTVAGLATHREGTSLWILDFFAYQYSIRAILEDLRDRVFKEHNAVTYFRYKGKRRIVKHISRQDKTSFFSSGARRTRTTSGDSLTRDEQILSDYRGGFVDAIKFGECLIAMNLCDPLSLSPLWVNIFRLRNLVTLDQFRLYRDANGVPVGLITWAWLSSHTISRLADTALHEAHISEWNEGTILCFCDVFVSNSVRDLVMDDLGGALFPDQQTILLYSRAYGKRPAFAQQVNRVKGVSAIERWVSRATMELLRQG